MSDEKKQQDREAAFIFGIGCHGVAAMGLIQNLFKVLREKQILSDVELALLFEKSIEQARGLGDPASERFAESVRQTIHHLANRVLVSPPDSVKH